jgi:hypothetical protein
MPAEGQVLREGEGKAPRGHAVDIPRLFPDVLLDRIDNGTVFEGNAQLHGSAITRMDRDQRGFTLLDDDGGRQRPPPGGQFSFRQCGLDGLVGVRLHAQGGQDLNQRLFSHRMRQAIPALERGSHAMRIGQPLEQMGVHGHAGSSPARGGRKPGRVCWHPCALWVLLV